jgi:hypothetical protein
VVQALGSDPAQVASTLRAQITPAQRAQWRKGDAASWAQEAYGVARSVAYTVGSPAACQQDAAPITLPAGYDAKAQAAAALQLERAGVRLGVVLNQALAGVTVPAAATPAFAQAAEPVPTNGAPAGGRTPASLACSAEADAKGLHGRERQTFRRACIRDKRSS